MNEILLYLKKHGERSDKEIAEATGIPLADLHKQLAELAAKNLVMLCHSTKYVKGKETKAIICRVAGYIPPAKPGAKSKVQLTLS
jgi:DNA-binding IclR family transcriptional regulator